MGYVFGPHGGLFAGGASIGAWGVWKYIFPRVLSNELRAKKVQVQALEKQVARLETELQPYKEWQNERMKEALNARKS